MKIGDKVNIRTDKDNIPLDLRGSEGIVISNEKFDLCSNKQRYWIRIKNIVGDRWFCKDELEKVEE